MADTPSILSVPYPTPGATYAASIALPGLSIIFVLLRIYTRFHQKIPFGVDDWLMLPALAMVVGMGITLVIGIHLKVIAYPTPFDADLTPEEKFSYVNPTMSRMMKIPTAFVYLMVLAFGFIKLSIIFLYRRLFVTCRGTLFDWATKISSSVVILWTISFFFGFVFSCGTHFSAAWGSLEESAKYCRELHLDNPFVVSDLVTDIMILCIPLPVIWDLHMTIGRKLVVTGILATGAISIVAAIIKVIVSFEIVNAGLTTYVDPDLNVTTILYWSMIEAGLAIIAACLPNLRFLLSKASLDSIVNSVRSALSLESFRSQRSRRLASPSDGSYANITPPGNASLSHMPMVSVTGSAGSLHSANKDVTKVKQSGIYVTSQISQQESMV